MAEGEKSAVQQRLDQAAAIERRFVAARRGAGMAYDEHAMLRDIEALLAITSALRAENMALGDRLISTGIELRELQEEAKRMRGQLASFGRQATVVLGDLHKAVEKMRDWGAQWG